MQFRLLPRYSYGKIHTDLIYKGYKWQVIKSRYLLELGHTMACLKHYIYFNSNVYMHVMKNKKIDYT